MRAHIPIVYRRNRKEDRLTHDANLAQRICKFFCYVLHRDFGFGKDRLNRMLCGVVELMTETSEDELFWEHLDQVVIDECGLDFSHEVVDTDGKAVNLRIK